jgi:hypothetical protein
MSNTDKRNGFQPLTSAGIQTRRNIRTVTVAGNPTTDLAPGDAYIINADGTISRSTGVHDAVAGVVEAIELEAVNAPFANQGPISYQYLPAATAGRVIGIEDFNMEFVAVAHTALALSDYDEGARVALLDQAPDTTLAQSRQAVDGIDASGPFKLVRPLDQVNNDQFAQYAKVVVRLVPANIQ